MLGCCLVARWTAYPDSPPGVVLRRGSVSTALAEFDANQSCSLTALVGTCVRRWEVTDDSFLLNLCCFSPYPTALSTRPPHLPPTAHTQFSFFLKENINSTFYPASISPWTPDINCRYIDDPVRQVPPARRGPPGPAQPPPPRPRRCRKLPNSPHLIERY